MHVVDLIRKKRDGGALTDAEIAYLVAGAATNSIPEYQLAAWLMAVVWRGLNPAELHSLTTHMRDSGRVLRFSSLPGVKVEPATLIFDRHQKFFPGARPFSPGLSRKVCMCSLVVALVLSQADGEALTRG